MKNNILSLDKQRYLRGGDASTSKILQKMSKHAQSYN